MPDRSVLSAEVLPLAVLSHGLVPLHAPVLLDIFREALDSSLIERGAAQGVELLGSADEFWRALALVELARMATAGNPQAQAELAWRYAVGGGGAEKNYLQAVRWATLSAERPCAAGESVLGWLLYHGFGLPGDMAEAARLFDSAAAAGEVQGLIWSGLCLLRGQGGGLDEARALALLRKAADKGGVSARLAQYWLGRIHYFGLPGFCARDFGEAVRYLREAVAHGHIRAHELLARCHFSGRGVPEDRREALRLWRVAAERGSSVAMYCAGLCLYAGEGAVQDYHEATVWLRSAARKQVAGAMFLLGQCHVFGMGVTQDLQAGLGWYRRGAESGNREAQFELAEWYAFGRGALQLDMLEAIRWYRLAARQGHTQAQRKLGHCYRNGDGISENKTRAIAWYRRAAEGGDFTARIWLGECYEQGDGVVVDPVRAAEHYRIAAEAGHPHGLAELGRCALHGVGMAANEALGERLLRAAAEAGWDAALGELERYCFFRAESLSARSVVSSAAMVEAAAYYRKAGELGHRLAALRLAECYRQGLGVPVDTMQAMTWYHKAARLFEAKVALADLYYSGHGNDGSMANHREAVRWYALAVAQHEEASAMYRLGFCLLHGQGCEATLQHVREGYRWLRKAAVLGMADAQYELGRAYAEGRGGLCRPRLSMKWLRSAARQGHSAAQTFLAGCEPVLSVSSE